MESDTDKSGEYPGLRRLLDQAQISDSEREQIDQVLERSAGDVEGTSDNAALEEKDAAPTDIRNLIGEMTIPEKIKLAMFGNSVARSVLLGDPNRLVQQAVLESPKLQASEVEAFAANPNVPEGVLRYISGVKEWMKSYVMKKNLVFNPKTPVDVSVKWVNFLHVADLRKISKSRNVPQVVSVSARRKLSEKQKR